LREHGNATTRRSTPERLAGIGKGNLDVEKRRRVTRSGRLAHNNNDKSNNSKDTDSITLDEKRERNSLHRKTKSSRRKEERGKGGKKGVRD